METEGLKTSYSSILLLILKEIRLERGIHQAVYAQMANKTPNMWSKIENGHSPLTMDTFLNICTCLGVSPSVVMATTERYVSYLTSSLYSDGVSDRWAVLNALNVEEDDLLKLSRYYYESPGFKVRPLNRNATALNTLIYLANAPAIVLEVFLYCKNKKFRSEQDNPVQPLPPITISNY